MKTLVTARLNEPITAGQNLIYCATVNLTWNELSDFMRGRVTFWQPCETVDFLNKRSFTKDHLDNNCYLAYASLIQDGILDRIKKDLREKFGETSKVNLNPANFEPTDILAYSFLLKILTFEKKFENLNQYLYFNGTTLVKAFGINKVRIDIEKKLKNQVYVLYYKNYDDFAIALRTQSSDIIVLIKTAPQRTIENIIKNTEALLDSTPHEGSRLQTNESLIIPKIEFDLEHHFREMIDQDIYVNGKITKYFIAESVQFIKFLLNEEGAKLRSEMAMLTKGMSHGEKMVRRFVFDKPFLIYLKEHTHAPYFAAWVANTEVLKVP